MLHPSTHFTLSFSGKFYDAAIQITKEVATAHAAAQRSPDEAVDIKRLIKYMSLASDSKNNDLARSALARTLYGFFKVCSLNLIFAKQECHFISLRGEMLPETDGRGPVEPSFAS